MTLVPGIPSARAWALAATLLGGLAASAATDDGASLAELHALHRQLTSAEPEAWESVPFRTDLLAAREEAARTARPLFLWSMNGHPLGCT